MRLVIAVLACLLMPSVALAQHHRALNRGLGGDYYHPSEFTAEAPPPRPQPSPVTRVYLLRGLGHLSPFGPLKRDLRATGAIVSIYGWRQRDRVVRDALRHPGDRIVVGGHSQGDDSAFKAGARLASHGVPAHVIGLDPLCTFPQSSVGGVNIWGNPCGAYPGTVPGAENIYYGGVGHVAYPTDPGVRAMFVRATYWQ